MSKILFVGDVHLTDSTPVSRKDAYPKTVLDKIQSLAGIVSANNIDCIIYEGDVFNTCTLSLSYLLKCMTAFKTIKVPQYFIIGNHDITYERLENYRKSPLSLLEMTGILTHLTHDNPLSFDDVLIYGFDYGQNITPVSPYSGKFNICVAHTFYDNELYGKTSSMLSLEDALKSNYNMFVLGHDHSIYKPVINGSFRLYRHGSLTRGTSSTSNIDRDIYVGCFDTVTKDWTLISVPHLPSSEVFRERVLLNKETPIEYNLDNIIDNLDYKETTSCYDQMDSMKIDEKIKNLITYYLELNGLYRTPKEDEDGNTK